LYQFTKRATKLTNNYRGLSLLSTSYKLLSNIRLSRLSPYIDGIIGDQKRAFRRNRSINVEVLCIRQRLEEKWDQNESTSAVHRLQESL
jgi:hypothetical protein